MWIGGASSEDVEKAGQFGEWSSEIGIPEADVVGVALHRRDESAANRLRLAAVALEVEHRETRRIFDAQ